MMRRHSLLPFLTLSLSAASFLNSLGGPTQNNEMKKTFLISMMVFFLVTACNGKKNIPTAFPSSTQAPNATTTSTPKKIRPTRTFPPPPTLTPFPAYQTKYAIFDYYEVGNHRYSDLFFAEDSCCSITWIVLYDDGQMIIAGKDETYKEKFLSSDEIKRFLSKLEALGFYSLESNQEHDPSDKLYDYGNNFQKSFDGLKECISVNADQSRDLCVYEPNLQFLIPQMKKILKYLDEYEPAGMTSYSPERIFLSIKPIDPSEETLPATAIPWNEHFPSLEGYTQGGNWDGATVYVDGERAKEIFKLFEGKEGDVIFSQNGKEYIVYIRVILPHEKITNEHQ
jgi:hypothetical protein